MGLVGGGRGGRGDIPVGGVVVEEAGGGLEEAFVVGRFVEVAGFKLVGEGLDGGESGRDVALGLGCRLTAGFGG